MGLLKYNIYLSFHDLQISFMSLSFSAAGYSLRKGSLHVAWFVSNKRKTTTDMYVSNTKNTFIASSSKLQLFHGKDK